MLSGGRAIAYSACASLLTRCRICKLGECAWDLQETGGEVHFSLKPEGFSLVEETLPPHIPFYSGRGLPVGEGYLFRILLSIPPLGGRYLPVGRKAYT